MLAVCGGGTITGKTLTKKLSILLTVLNAERSLSVMQIRNANSVRERASLPHSGEPLKKTDLDAMLLFQASLSIARTMLSRGLIDQSDYDHITQTLAEKYHVSSCSIAAG